MLSEAQKKKQTSFTNGIHDFIPQAIAEVSSIWLNICNDFPKRKQ